MPPRLLCARASFILAQTVGVFLVCSNVKEFLNRALVLELRTTLTPHGTVKAPGQRERHLAFSLSA